MKRSSLFVPVLLLAMASAIQAQTVLKAPEVQGCTNPAPAVPPATTVWLSVCKAPAFMPLTSASVVASASKTAPVWAHTFSGYAATDLVVACPINATLSADGTKCTNAAGADVSALTAVSVVPTFSIAAPSVPTVATVGLSWTAPTQNADGTALTDLKGYNVYQGATAASLVKVGTIALPALSYTTAALPAGTFYFAVTAFNSANVESAQSAVVSATLTTPPPAPKTPGVPSSVKITVTVTAGP